MKQKNVIQNRNEILIWSYQRYHSEHISVNDQMEMNIDQNRSNFIMLPNR